MVDRDALTEIIEADGGVNWWVLARFETSIRKKLPTELEIISPPPPEAKNYNCFVYAFGLQEDADFLGGKNPIQQEFVKYLILKGLLIPVETPQNCLIFYEDEKGNITHGGILLGEAKVISKWMWGPTFVHEVWDVPSSFGNKSLLFKALPANEIKNIYQEYRDSGATVRPIT